MAVSDGLYHCGHGPDAPDRLTKSPGESSPGLLLSDRSGIGVTWRLNHFRILRFCDPQLGLQLGDGCVEFA